MQLEQRFSQVLFLIVFILCFLPQNLSAGGIKKGFVELERNNFYNAEKVFRKKLKRKKCVASFGLSLYFIKEPSPYFNIDSAYHYILFTESEYALGSPRKKAKWHKKFSLNDSTISSQKEHIALKWFLDIEHSDSLEAFVVFANKNPFFSGIENAITIRNEIAFRQAMKQNTYQAFQDFLEKYPDADEKVLAQKKYDELFFYSMTKDSTLETYKRFIVEFPDSPFKKHAENKVYELLVPAKNEKNLLEFIRQNPNNINVDEAWKELYKHRIMNFSPEELSEFMLDYPDFPFKDKLVHDLSLSTQLFIPAQENKMWGYIDSNGKWLIKPQFSWIEPFSEGKALVGLDDKTAYITKNAAFLYLGNLKDAFQFENGIAVVENEKGTGAINYKGDLFLSFEFDELNYPKNNMILAQKESLYGYFNKSGELQIPFSFSLAFHFEGDYAIVKNDSAYSLINHKGELVFPYVFERIYSPVDSAVVAQHQGKWGVLNLAGDTLSEFEYDFIGSFNHQQPAIRIKGKTYDYIDSKGKVKIALNYDVDNTTSVYASFKDGFAKYKYKSKFGLIDTAGNRIAPAVYSEIGLYKGSGAIPVSKNGKWGFVSVDAKMQIDFKFDYAYPFEGNDAIVQYKQLYGMIDGEGNWILENNFEEIQRIDSSIVKAKQNGKWGLYQNKNVLSPPVFDEIETLFPGFIALKINDESAVYSLFQRKIIWQSILFSDQLLKEDNTDSND
jgi:hypothetical protein